MADLKISQLNSIVTVVPATDVLPVVQGGTTLKITPKQILESGSPAVLASATITGDLTVRTNKLAVTSTGVGCGTATPANQLSVRNEGASGVSVIDIRGGTGGAGALQISGNGTTLGTTSFDFIQNGAGAFILNRDATPLAFFVNGAERYYIGTTGISTWSVAGSTAMTLNSTGLGIGDAPASGEKLTVLGSIYLKTANKLKLDNASNNFGASIHNIGASAQAALAFTLGATQAMTLDASGNLLVGKTATNLQVVGCELKANGTVFSTLVDTTDAAASSYQLYSTGATAYRFYVGLGGTVFATNTSISAISDARLKENVQDIDVGLAAILSLKPRKFDWKAGKGKDIKGDRGFIAQEFETVFPNLIDEWKDSAPEGEAPYKSVRQDLIPVLVKAIQELTARVQTLEAR